MSINSIYPDLWAPIASLLQGLTVMQQCVYQMKFRNVWRVKKRLVQPGLVWSKTLSIIDTAVNEWKKCLLASVRIVANTSSNFTVHSWKMDT